MPETIPYPGTQAVRRALGLLKMFTEGEPELGLTELARRAGLNKTTTYRLLTALELEGMLARNPTTEAYRLGPQAIVLGGYAQRANNLHHASRTELEALAHATGESVTLEVLVGEDVMVISEFAGHHVLGASQTVGSRWPAVRTSTGKAILAYLTDTQRQDFALPDELRQALPAICAQGFAIANGDLEEDFVAIGAPVFNHLGQVVGAISAGGPSTRFAPPRIEQMTQLVREAAARISRNLGYGL